MNTLTVSELKNGTEYTFRLLPVNSDGIYGTPKDVTFKTLLPEYEIGDIVLKKGNEIKTGLDGAGTYTLTVPVKNNTITSGMPYEQLVFVDSGITLEKVYSSKQTLGMTAPNAPFYEVTTTFEVPALEDCSVTVLLINSRDKMDWYIKPVIIK